MDYPEPQKPGIRGFTIIETMIVLAVGTLIITIMLLAVPALERNSRNNQRRQDIQIVLQAVSNYELNNSGNVPDNAQLRSFLTNYEQGKITYYTPGNISSTVQNTSNRTDRAAVTDPDVAQVYNYEKCDTATLGKAVIAGAGYNDVVALYAVETGSGVSSQCEQL